MNYQEYFNALNESGITELLAGMGGIIVYLILGFLFSVSYRTLACLAIYNDAASRGIKDKNLFTALEFFFPVIVAIIYLCLRKNATKVQPKMCNNCKTTVNTKSTFCPNCLGVEFTDYLIPNYEKMRKNARVFAIISIVMYCLTAFINSFGKAQIEKFNESLQKDYGTYEFDDEYDNLDDFLKQFDDFEGSGGYESFE